MEIFIEKNDFFKIVHFMSNCEFYQLVIYLWSGAARIWIRYDIFRIRPKVSERIRNRIHTNGISNSKQPSQAWPPV